MPWNFRVVRIEDADGPGVPGFVFRTAYYSAGRAPDSIPDSIGEDDVAPYGDNPEELNMVLDQFKRALTMPVLNNRDYKE